MESGRRHGWFVAPKTGASLRSAPATQSEAQESGVRESGGPPLPNPEPLSLLRGPPWLSVLNLCFPRGRHSWRYLHTAIPVIVASRTSWSLTMPWVALMNRLWLVLSSLASK